MNHKWENDKCSRCGIIRSEIKSVDDKKNDILMYQYSDNSGKSWIIKRPDCNNIKPMPFSIKDVITDDIKKPINDYKQDYSELLKHPKWQRKRLEIMQRDEFKCCLCLDEETTLNTHHKKYINGNKPWEYENEDLITYCEDCHFIVEFFKKANVDISDSKILKIKGTVHSEIYFFISFRNDATNGFWYVAYLPGEKGLLHCNCFGNKANSFDKIVNFLSDIKTNG